MPKTVRNVYDKYLTYDSLMAAHLKARKGKCLKKEVIMFNMKQEEYIAWLYEQLKNRTYKHGGYTAFYVTEPKLRKIEKSRYMDRIVHTWLVENFLKPAFVPQFIPNSYACLVDRGMHKGALFICTGARKRARNWQLYLSDVCQYLSK